MGIYKIDDELELDIVGISQGVPGAGHFSEKEILAAIIAVEDILNMEGCSLGDGLEEKGVERRSVFQLFDNAGEYQGDIWYENFGTLQDVMERLGQLHTSMLEAAYDEQNDDIAKALILIENHTYIRDLLGSIDADTRAAMKDKYYGVEGGTNIKRAEALFNYGPSDDYVGFDAGGRLDIDALGYLADRLIAAKIMDTQSAYQVIEYNGQLCEVYVDNGDINDFSEEIKNGTLLDYEGDVVCSYDSYRELIDAQKEMILTDFNDIGLYEDDGSWGFYLTEKELRFIGLSKELDKEIEWYEKEYGNQREVLVVGDVQFELVDELPLGYQFWNIGRNMPDGYLPLCRQKMIQPFDGAREIETDTLKAVRLEGAQTVLRASVRGFGTVEEMKQFVAECQDAVARGKMLSAAKQEDFERVKAALEALKPLTMEKTLAKVLEDASLRSKEKDRDLAPGAMDCLDK